jgi:hypothetical protein
MTPEIAGGLDEKAEEAQAGFLIAAIEDTRDVIRVIDTKIGALFFGLSIPLSKLAAIWVITKDVLERSSGAGRLAAVALVVVFAVSWAISLLASLRAIFHVDNPAEHVAGEKPAGVFYSANLFPASWRDAFFPRRVRSRVEFATFFAGLPQTSEAARKELTFEFMKLVYIRTIKMRRAKLAFYAFYVWMVSGGLIWLVQLAR